MRVLHALLIASLSSFNHCYDNSQAAHVGLAMNLCGSDVAKDAADMIIMNDDFGSIVNAVTKKHVVA